MLLLYPICGILSGIFNCTSSLLRGQTTAFDRGATSTDMFAVSSSVQQLLNIRLLARSAGIVVWSVSNCWVLLVCLLANVPAFSDRETLYRNIASATPKTAVVVDRSVADWLVSHSLQRALRRLNDHRLKAEVFPAVLPALELCTPRERHPSILS